MRTPDSERLADEIRDLMRSRMEALHINQAELARRIGLKPQAVSKWFAGENPTFPSAARFPAIEDALELRRHHIDRIIIGEIDPAEKDVARDDEALLKALATMEEAADQIRAALGLPARQVPSASRKAK